MARVLLALCVALVVLCCCLCVVSGDDEVGEDFYVLLGVDKGADDKTIRKAFKKLAIRLHPDKNVGDPEAHNKFVKVNRAYEVLKDEELRKKYDTHGEKGLKDDFNGGQQYQSWQFYRDNFGIYDDDVDVITVNRGDFESLTRSKDRWFINFYSPQCGHCHDMAPTWRKVAQELKGVIRIGAVNCGDEWVLCRNQGIMSYPSLIMYPERQKFQGEREHDKLVEYILNHLSSRVHRVNIDNYKRISQSDKRDSGKKPWLLDLCSEDEESCLSTPTKQKLAAMLDSLVNVGTVNCVKEPLCKQLGRNHGVVYYSDGILGATENDGVVLNSLDTQEIAAMVMKLLPEMDEITEEKFQAMLTKVYNSEISPRIVYFAAGENDVDLGLELKKLPALLNDVQCIKVNCSVSQALCARYHLSKYPTFAVFKQNGGYEIHHGRHTAHDIASFVSDCARTNVRVLDAALFDETVGKGDTWFVDFFAPWCPPCMRLLPKFRRASVEMNDDSVNFGTIDCTIHGHLCQRMGVQSYPTTILFNATERHPMVGPHSVHELMQFIEDVRNPPVIDLSPDTFKTLVVGRPAHTVFLVDFFAPWCGPCQQLAPEYRQVAKMLKTVKTVSVGHVNCDKHSALCSSSHVQSYPTIRLYTSDGRNSVDYPSNFWRNAASIRQWLQQYLPTKVKTLEGADFVDRVLNGDAEDVWLVDFYAPWCGHCQVFAPEFEVVAEAMEGRVKCAKVDCDRHPNVCKLAGIRAYPSVKLFMRSAGVDSDQSPDPHGVDIHSQDSTSIINYLKSQLGDGDSADVPPMAGTEQYDQYDDQFPDEFQDGGSFEFVETSINRDEL